MEDLFWNNNILFYDIKLSEVDDFAINMLRETSQNTCIAEILHSKSKNKFIFSTDNFVTLSSAMEELMDTKTILSILIQICDTINYIKTSMLFEENLVFDTEYMFQDTETNELKMLYIPIQEYIESINIKNFFKELIFNFDFDDYAIIRSIFRYISKKDFDLDNFYNFLIEKLHKLGTNDSSINENGFKSNNEVLSQQLVNPIEEKNSKTDDKFAFDNSISSQELVSDMVSSTENENFEANDEPTFDDEIFSQELVDDMVSSTEDENFEANDEPTFDDEIFSQELVDDMVSSTEDKNFEANDEPTFDDEISSQELVDDMVSSTEDENFEANDEPTFDDEISSQELVDDMVSSTEDENFEIDDEYLSFEDFLKNEILENSDSSIFNDFSETDDESSLFNETPESNDTDKESYEDFENVDEEDNHIIDDVTFEDILKFSNNFNDLQDDLSSGELNDNVNQHESSSVKMPVVMPTNGELNDNVKVASLVREKDNFSKVVNKKYFVIGKSETTDFRIDDNKTISRSHATIIHRGNDYYISDNGSTNGTWVNGQTVKALEDFKLEDNDKIMLASKDEILTFHLI